MTAYRYLEPGERIRAADERNDGTKYGGREAWTYERVPRGLVGRLADESLTIRRPVAASPAPSAPAPCPAPAKPATGTPARGAGRFSVELMP